VLCGLLLAFGVLFYVWRYRQDKQEKRRSLLHNTEIGRQQSHQEREGFAKEGDIARANEMRAKGEDHPLAMRVESPKETKQLIMPTTTKANRYVKFAPFIRDYDCIESNMALRTTYTLCKVIYYQLSAVQTD
jgi:hypothetical protein